MTYGWVWLAIAAVAVLVTIITKKIQYLAFIPGAVAAMVLDIFDKNLFYQLIALVVGISVVFIILAFILTAVTKKKKSRSVLVSVVGAKCMVVEVIDEFAGSGQVRVNGQEWAARLVDEEDVAEIGEVLRIVAIEGPKLICKR